MLAINSSEQLKPVVRRDSVYSIVGESSRATQEGIHGRLHAADSRTTELYSGLIEHGAMASKIVDMIEVNPATICRDLQCN